MKNKTKKLLFIPLGIGIAHTSRLIVVAKELEKRGHKIVFGVGKQAANIVNKEGIRYTLMPELDKKVVDQTKRLKTDYFSVKAINKFVTRELDMYKKEKPDLVISDTRITAWISTKMAGIPHVTINNANVTKYYNYRLARFPIPTFFLSEFLPIVLLKQLEKEWMQKNILSKVGPTLVEAKLIKQLVKFNYVLQKYNLSPIRSLTTLLQGDLNLISDASFFRPLKKLPDNVKLVGPIYWQPTMTLPKWADRVIKEKQNGKKIIYVTAGGTGDPKVFVEILEHLSGFPSVVIATTGNAMKTKSIKIKSDSMFITDYLPGDWAMQTSDLVIFFAGNLTVYQALSNGTPQIVLPMHLDQQDNANQMVRIGTCKVLNPFGLKKEDLIMDVLELLNDKKYKKASEKYKKQLQKFNGPKVAADEIEVFLTNRKSLKNKKRTTLREKIRSSTHTVKKRLFRLNQ